jgi:hypothetical protein
VKASSPAAHDPRRGVEPSPDLDVASALGRVEDDPRPLHLAPGALLGAGDPFELVALFVAQLDSVTSGACHADHLRHAKANSFKNSG